MSHGPSGEGSKAEPNLTPLLDVVLQLLMFFMMCVNFVSEQVNKDINLPKSQQAKPMDKSETSVLFLNLDKMGRLHFPGENPLEEKDRELWRARLLQKFQDDENENKQTTIVLRADEVSTYGQVYELFRLCKEIGYRKLCLRALSQAKG